MNGRTRELYLPERVEDAALKAVKESLLDGHMKSALNGKPVASPARGSNPTSGGSTQAEKDLWPGHQIRTLTVFIHLSSAIIHARSIITSASTTAASLRYHITHYLHHVCRVTCAQILMFSILQTLSRLMVGICTLFLHILRMLWASTDGKKGHIATKKYQLF